jgi:hypothetical protein
MEPLDQHVEAAPRAGRARVAADGVEQERGRGADADGGERGVGPADGREGGRDAGQRQGHPLTGERHPGRR